MMALLSCWCDVFVEVDKEESNRLMLIDASVVTSTFGLRGGSFNFVLFTVVMYAWV
jgi:hypothetical protein